MREIKFRVWHKSLKQMFWFDVTWGNRFATGGGWICALPIEETELKHKLYHGDNRVALEPDECEFMQFTGLHDKNGKEIYEGDIFGNEWLRCIVKREEDGAYKLHFVDKRIKPISILDRKVSKSAIVGNLFENPELIETKTEPA